MYLANKYLSEKLTFPLNSSPVTSTQPDSSNETENLEEFTDLYLELTRIQNEIKVLDEEVLAKQTEETNQDNIKQEVRFLNEASMNSVLNLPIYISGVNL